MLLVCQILIQTQDNADFILIAKGKINFVPKWVEYFCLMCMASVSKLYILNMIYVKNTHIYEHPMHNCTCFMVAFDFKCVLILWNNKLALYEIFRLLSLKFLHVRTNLYIFTVYISPDRSRQRVLNQRGPGFLAVLLYGLRLLLYPHLSRGRQ
jgi:hypothetical protein